ncbi:hypothetical protein Aperf_G00000035759 [Anoplocephala perfoliata]
MSANGFSQQSLYGGALQICLPSPVIDASNFRQVPDNQEVFVNPTNNQSIIVDILEAVPEADLTEAVKLHFQEIADCNSAIESTVDSIEVQNIPDSPPAVLLRGRQKTAKFNNQEADIVAISVMLYRFAQFSSDILVCFNDPILCQDQAGDTSSDSRWLENAVIVCLSSLKLLDPFIFA